LAVHLQLGPELEKAERKAAEWERFKTLICQIEQASESICDARPPLSEHPCAHFTIIPSPERLRGE
jgi:hypothetical protein